MSESLVNKEAKKELINELDRDAILGFEIIENITESQKNIVKF